MPFFVLAVREASEPRRIEWPFYRTVRTSQNVLEGNRVSLDVRLQTPTGAKSARFAIHAKADRLEIMRRSLRLFPVLAFFSWVGCSDGSANDSPGNAAGSPTDAAASSGSTTGGLTGASGTTSGNDSTSSTSGSTATTGFGNTSEANTGASNTSGANTGGGNTSGPANATGAGATNGSGGSGGSGTTTDSGGTTGSGGTSGDGGDCQFEPGLNPNRVCIKGKKYYLNGINVAWDQWTYDLTNYDSDNFQAMFSSLAAAGGNPVRWWWFIDGENQLTFSGNRVGPLAQSIFDNLDAAFDAAAAHGILIMPVLLSFDIEGPGREFLVTDDDAIDAFVTNVVTPLVERYNDHPGLGLWEIMNEGDWLLSDEGGSVSIADYQRFHGKVAAGIHAADADALVTTGSASFKYLEPSNNILSDDALQAAADGDPLAYLDVYQIHYYGWMHGDGWSYEPWIRTSTEWQDDGKPILIGEFPCIGEQGRWTTMQMHVESVNQGYAGTFCWAYFDNRADSEGTWDDARSAVQAIAEQIPEAITGE